MLWFQDVIISKMLWHYIQLRWNAEISMSSFVMPVWCVTLVHRTSIISQEGSIHGHNRADLRESRMNTVNVPKRDCYGASSQKEGYE